ncbi:MAG: MerR family transcriptional regulator [Acidobacteria bacterium]|nr:MerR family transcriptional regulator [Acidobacteriota bacterium]
MDSPSKLFFKRSEVCERAGVPAHVLRAWEGEFSIPAVKSASGQKLYRQADIDTVLKVKALIYEQGLTISGARKRLDAELPPKAAQIPLRDPTTELLHEIRTDLRDLLTLLAGDGRNSNDGT